MNFGMIALAVLAAWSALSVVASVLVGGMAHGRDAIPADPAIESIEESTEPSRQRVAS